MIASLLYPPYLEQKNCPHASKSSSRCATYKLVLFCLLFAIATFAESSPLVVTITQDNQHWSINASDSNAIGNGGGIVNVLLAYNSAPDTSMNVRFNPTPPPGKSMTMTFGIVVVDGLQEAQASLHVHDQSGNAFDTLLDFVPYSPQYVSVEPRLLNVGAVRSFTSVIGSVVMTNHTALPFTVTSYRLRYGMSHGWSIIQAPDSPASPAIPLTISPHTTATFFFRYTAPAATAFQIDNDTFYITTCSEYPAAALLGLPKAPAIFTQCYDFGNAEIDTLGTGGDTISSLLGHGVWVASVGTDTVHITGVKIVGAITPTESHFPASDFWLGSLNYKVRYDKTVIPLSFLPGVALDSNWVLAPQETAFVQVVAHPHHSGLRGNGLQSDDPTNYAFVQFDNDASHEILDQACLTMLGLVPPVGIEQREIIKPLQNKLLPNYPNPFSSSTTLSYTLGTSGHVMLRIVNALGETVSMLVNEHQSSGTYTVTARGAGLRAGMYFVEMVSGGERTGKKIFMVE